MARDDTRRHGKAREDTTRHEKAQQGTRRHEKAREGTRRHEKAREGTGTRARRTRARNVSYSAVSALQPLKNLNASHSRVLAREGLRVKL